MNYGGSTTDAAVAGVAAAIGVAPVEIAVSGNHPGEKRRDSYAPRVLGLDSRGARDFTLIDDTLK